MAQRPTLIRQTSSSYQSISENIVDQTDRVLFCFVLFCFVFVLYCFVLYYIVLYCTGTVPPVSYSKVVF